MKWTWVVLGILACGLTQGATFETDVKGAFRKARKLGKPLLVDFYGIWCPPCNELDETVFESRPFLERAQKFVLLKVDADDKKSWPLKDKYKVGGYPTVIFTNPRGEEIYRIVGYRTPAEFNRVMDSVVAANGKSFQKACESALEDDLWRCVVSCSERKETGCADTAFAKLEKLLTPGTARFDVAQTYAIQQAATADLKRAGYEKLMQLYPDSPSALVWALAYLDTFEETSTLKPKSEIFEPVLEKYAKMAGTARAEQAGLSDTDLAQMRADLLDRIGKRDASRSAWKEAAALLEKAAQSLGSQPTRGFAIERIGALENAGDTTSAMTLAEQYAGRYPKEFTFHYMTASMLRRSKKMSEAIAPAKKALEYSYGDNKIRAATLLIELLATVPAKEEARKVFEEIKASVHPDASLQVRTHRYLKKLDDVASSHGITKK